MATDTLTPARMAPPSAKDTWLGRAAAIGPGLIFALGTVGPRDLISNSIAGSTDGYSLLWLVVCAATARYVVLEATARSVMVTGQSLLTGFGNWHRWVVFLWFAAAMIRRHSSMLLDFVLLGVAADFVLPLPSEHSVAIWSFSSWIAGFVIMYWGRYGLAEKICKPLALLMGASLAAAAILSKPDIGELVQGAFTPAMPHAGGLYSPVLVLMAVLSAAFGSMANLKYAAYVHEKGWRDLSFQKTQRLDLFISMGTMALMLMLIQIAAAGALRPNGIEVAKVEDIVPIFASILGNTGRIVMGATLWAVVFSSYVSSGTGYGLMVADVYHRFIRPSAIIERQDSGLGASHLPAYRWLLIYLFVSPLYVFLTDWTPVGLVLFRNVLSIVSVPVVLVVVMRLTADRKIMGDQVNGWFTNAVMIFTGAGALFLSYRTAVEFVARWF